MKAASTNLGAPGAARMERTKFGPSMVRLHAPPQCRQEGAWLTRQSKEIQQKASERLSRFFILTINNMGKDINNAIIGTTRPSRLEVLRGPFVHRLRFKTRALRRYMQTYAFVFVCMLLNTNVWLTYKCMVNVQTHAFVNK